jgi:serine/threonine protein kinase
VKTTEILDAPTQRAPDAPARTGEGPLVLDRYRLVRRLGTGGFGAVWLAWDEHLEREVAVKAVPRSGAHDARAEREALAAARLNHPGIVTLYEAGGDESGHYLVSELVHGTTLHDLESAGALSDRDVVRVGLALADALDHAHRRGVIHRDVKPQNVIVPHLPESPAGVAKLTDFGIATLAGDDPLTRTGDVVGTLAYMAPEQAEGRRVGPAADVYALGLVLYEALAGRHPVRGAGPADTARRLGATLPSLGRARRDLPAPLVAGIDRAVRPQPEERGSLDDLRRALDEAVSEVSDEGGTLAAPALDRRLPRGAGRLAGALAAGALAAAGCAWIPEGSDGTSVADALGAGPALAGLAVAAAVLVLPRVGWAAAAAAWVALLAAPPVDSPGAALLAGLALAACPLLLPRAGKAWSAPALAPALGFAGLAAGWCALAGQARRPLRRAGLGGAGFIWVALAEPVFGRALYAGPAPGTPPPEDWTSSARDAASQALEPLATSGLLLGALLWAAAALVLPWMVRGRRPLADVVSAVAWAGGLAAAGAALAGIVEPGSHPYGGLAGPALAAAAAVVLRWARGPDPPRLPAGDGAAPPT